jgi:hypothetical protein
MLLSIKNRLNYCENLTGFKRKRLKSNQISTNILLFDAN